ncbi:MAG: hypothetical protein OXI15_19335, partial [Chromatiales bacterium]|nr:hypothetical protein [Chromatiales bacterium]
MSTPGLPPDEIKIGLLADDYAESKETTGTVTVGGTATGEIQSTRHVPEPGWFTSDHDWFAVELEAGKTYRIELRGADTEDGTLPDPLLFGIYDADGGYIDRTRDDDAGVGRNSRTIFEPGSSGTYYVAAAGGWNGTYTLSVEEVSLSDDYAASVSTTGTVAVGGSTTGNIEKPGDRDWLAVELEAGKLYRIDLRSDYSQDDPLTHIGLAGIYDSGGAHVDETRVQPGRNGGWSHTQKHFTPDTSGTYHVGVESIGRSDHTGVYTVAVQEMPQDDYAASVSTTGTVAVGGSATGGIDKPGDHDWFAVELEAGTTYVIFAKGADTGDGTLPDPKLAGVYDAGGDLAGGVFHDDSLGTRNSFGSIVVATTGTYYVSVGAYKNNTGTYTVAVDSHPPKPKPKPLDADAPVPEITIADATVVEGGAAQVTVSLDRAPSEDATVWWQTSDGTAGSGDYSGQTTKQKIVFNAGETSKVIAIDTTQDTVHEGSETFTVTLSDPSGATLGADPTATVTITDDDAVPEVTVAGATVAEGGTAQVTVSLDRASSKDVTVWWQTSDGTAGSGDYSGPSAKQKIVFKAGETS